MKKKSLGESCIKDITSLKRKDYLGTYLYTCGAKSALGIHISDEETMAEINLELKDVKRLKKVLEKFIELQETWDKLS
jgi:hypothetical protein